MKKRLFALALSVCMLFSVLRCKDKKEEGEQRTAELETETIKIYKYKIFNEDRIQRLVSKFARDVTQTDNLASLKLDTVC